MTSQMNLVCEISARPSQFATETELYVTGFNIALYCVENHLNIGFDYVTWLQQEPGVISLYKLH